MNKRVNSFIRTIRHFHVCSTAQISSSQTAARTSTFGINGPKHTVNCVYLWRFPLNVLLRWHESSILFFSQKTLVCSVGYANAQKQNAGSQLVDSVQRPGQMPLDSSQPSSFLDPVEEKEREEDTNVVEEELEVKEKRCRPQPAFYDFQKCTSPCDVLDLASESLGTLKHTSHYLAAMWKITKKLPKGHRYYERQLMFEHPAFSHLCYHVMQESRNMWWGDLVYSLHALVQLKVPQNTRLVQTLLRACQERLNEFDDRCVCILATTLETMEKSKNRDALQAGLRLLVEQQILEVSDVHKLQVMMKCIGSDASDSLKRKIERKVLNEVNQLTTINAQHMFAILDAMHYRSTPVLEACSNKVIDNIHGTPFVWLMRIITACVNLEYRNAVLCDEITNYVASTFFMWDTKQVVQFLSAFEHLKFRPAELIDVFAEKVTTHPEFLNLKTILTVLWTYSRHGYVPKCQNQQFFEALNSALNKYLYRISNVYLLDAVYSFCVLGYFPQLALNQLMQEDILDDLVKSDGMKIQKNKMMLHIVNVCLELESPSFTKTAAMSTWKPSISVSDTYEVEETLLALLGDQSLFQSKVQVSHGYIIDFVIKMDAEQKEVFPVYKADVLTDDSNVQRVALLCVSMSSFCWSTKHPRGYLAMRMRHLKILGYHVIPICNQEFKNLKKEEAVEYLRGKIFSAKV